MPRDRYDLVIYTVRYASFLRNWFEMRKNSLRNNSQKLQEYAVYAYGF